MQSAVFVDDEPHVLNGLRRMLRPLRSEWQMSFVNSGQEALELLEHEPCDVLFSDIRMPGMSGAQLLEIVMNRYPDVIRIALSGESGQDGVLGAVGLTHQYLSKPCDPETVKATLDRARRCRNRMTSNAFQRIAASVRTLPSPPSIYNEMLRILALPNSSVRDVAQVIARDVGMTAKVLQLVNSAYFGIARPISDPVRAVTLLGIDMVKSLVLTSHIFTEIDREALAEFPLRALWQHSIATGAFALRIARERHHSREEIDDAYTASLLHDVGLLIMASNLGEQFQHVLDMSNEEHKDLFAMETDTLGVNHAEVGAYLMSLWGLPEPVVDGIALHHSPRGSTTKSPGLVATVYLANLLERERHAADGLGPPPVPDTEYLAEAGLTKDIPRLRRLCSDLPTTGAAI